MLRLRRCILFHLVSPASSTSALSTLHHPRPFSATVLPKSPTPGFAVEEYLVATCGLTQPQAVKASAALSHLKSPSNPDAVLAFLRGLGLSGADVTAAVARDPNCLYAGVERTLNPRVSELEAIGLLRSEVARLLPLAVGHFRRRQWRSQPRATHRANSGATVSNSCKQCQTVCRFEPHASGHGLWCPRPVFATGRRYMAPKLQYYVGLFGLFEDLLRVLQRSTYLLSADLERVAKPNVALLQGCGLGARDIAKLCVLVPRVLNTSPERVRAMVARAEAVGVPRASGTFRHALHAVAFLSKEEIAAKVEYLKETFRWSDDEVGAALSRSPQLLRCSKDKLQRTSEFLVAELGLEPQCVAQWSEMICYSLEGRLRPRYYVVKFDKGIARSRSELL